MWTSRHVQRCQARYKQATFVSLLLITPFDDRGQVLLTSTDDRRLLIVAIVMTDQAFSVRAPKICNKLSFNCRTLCE